MPTDTNRFIPYTPIELDDSTRMDRSRQLLETMRKRRSIRSFSAEDVPFEIIENIVMTAASAPSGANKQPWTFCVVSAPAIKRQIRKAAEEEERLSYETRMSEEWLEDLEPFGTNWQKPFLEVAPYLIVVFKKPFDWVNGKKKKNYYVNESVGIATGFLISTIHQAGLVTLTHTPSPMRFLEKILERPDNERAFLLLPVGYPAPGVQVPNIRRKKKEEVLKVYEGRRQKSKEAP